jgi:hypothetical protein
MIPIASLTPAELDTIADLIAAIDGQLAQRPHVSADDPLIVALYDLLFALDEYLFEDGTFISLWASVQQAWEWEVAA